MFYNQCFMPIRTFQIWHEPHITLESTIKNFKFWRQNLKPLYWIINWCRSYLNCQIFWRISMIISRYIWCTKLAFDYFSSIFYFVLGDLHSAESKVWNSKLECDAQEGEMNDTIRKLFDFPCHNLKLVQT